MTYVGHSLMGVSLGVLLCPARWRGWRRAGFLTLCAASASIPDIPTPYWGHHRYDISHSLVLMLGLWLAAYLLIRLGEGLAKRRIPRRVLLAVAVCWLSHFALDLCYNHGYALRAFWPISRARIPFTFSMPWFNIMDPNDRFGPHSLRVYLIELLFWGGVLSGCIAARRWWRRRNGKGGAALPA